MAKIDIGICLYEITGEEESKAQEALKNGVHILDRSHLGCENYYMELAGLRDSIEREYGVTIKNI